MRWASLALVSLLAAIPAPAVCARTTATPAQMAEYLVRLAEYDAARAAYQVRAAPYWAAVKAKRASRTSKRRAHREITLDDYVLTQPPEYTGPKKPINPTSTAREVPVVADYLQHAAQQFDFAPEKPASEIDFKRAYARVAAAAGLTRDQAGRGGSMRSRPPATANTISLRARSLIPMRRRSRPRSATTSCSRPTASSFWPSRAGSSSRR